MVLGWLNPWMQMWRANYKLYEDLLPPCLRVNCNLKLGRITHSLRDHHVNPFPEEKWVVPENMLAPEGKAGTKEDQFSPILYTGTEDPRQLPLS